MSWARAFRKQINDPEILLADPVEKLTPLVPLLKEQKPDHMVLLAFASKEDSIALGQQFPQFDIVVTAGGAPEPPREAQTIPGTSTLLIEVGEKTEDAMVLAFYKDSAAAALSARAVGFTVRRQNNAAAGTGLNSRPCSNAHGQLPGRTQGGRFPGAGAAPSPYPKQELLGRFVGSEKCESCHEGSFIQWKKTPHPTPTKPWPSCRCRGCSIRSASVATSSAGTRKTSFPTSRVIAASTATPQLINVGCESCHGPGERHIAAENGTDAALQKKIQQLIRVSKEDAQGDQQSASLPELPRRGQQPRLQVRRLLPQDRTPRT